MRRKEMLDFLNLKNNLISIFIITIPPAILYDVLNYIVQTPSSINRILSLTIMYILLIYILKRPEHSIINYSYLKSKAFGYLILSLLIPIAVESITYPIILKLVDKTPELIKSDFYLILLCSLSARILEIFILVFVFLKKNSKFQINVRDYIFKNKFFMRSTMGLIIGLIIFEAYFMKSLVYNNLLSVYNTIYEQLFIVIGITFLMPVMLIIAIYSFINYCLIINYSEKQIARND